MAEAVKTLVCSQCAKSYAWKPQYAGRALNTTALTLLNVTVPSSV